MQRFKIITITTSLLFVFCFFSASLVAAQNPSRLKDKQKIYVIVKDEKSQAEPVKKQIENLLAQSGRFEIVQNQKDADIVYVSLVGRFMDSHGASNINQKVYRVEGFRGDLDTSNKLANTEILQTPSDKYYNAAFDNNLVPPRLNSFSGQIAVRAEAFSASDYVNQSPYSKKSLDQPKALWWKQEDGIRRKKWKQIKADPSRDPRLSLVKKFIEEADKID